MAYFLERIKDAQWVKGNEKLILFDLIRAGYDKREKVCIFDLIDLGLHAMTALTKAKKVKIKEQAETALSSNTRAFLDAYAKRLIGLLVPDQAIRPDKQKKVPEDTTVRVWPVVKWLHEVIGDEKKGSTLEYNTAEALLVAFGQYGDATTVGLLLSDEKIAGSETMKWVREGDNRR